MELGTLCGLILAFVALFGAVLIEGGHLTTFINISAFMIVIGGTIGATFVSFPLKQVLALPKVIMGAFFCSKMDGVPLVNMLVNLADKARRQGLLALEEEGQNLDNRFLKKGVQLLVDGTDPELLRNIMDIEMSVIDHRNEAGYGVLEAMGGYAPTMGIIGMVMGLVHALGGLDEPSNLGPAIAVAFIATFYGVFTANVLWLPLASKVKKKCQQESLLHQAMLEGLLSIQAGDNPRIVREKLEGFLDPRTRSEQYSESMGREAKQVGEAE